MDPLILPHADLWPLETYARLFGRYTPEAIRKKIERKQWRPGREYHKAPDGAIWISIAGVESWVRGSAARASKSTTAQSGSISDWPASCTERV